VAVNANRQRRRVPPSPQILERWRFVARKYAIVKTLRFWTAPKAGDRLHRICPPGPNQWTLRPGPFGGRPAASANRPPNLAPPNAQAAKNQAGNSERPGSRTGPRRPNAPAPALRRGTAIQFLWRRATCRQHAVAQHFATSWPIGEPPRTGSVREPQMPVAPSLAAQRGGHQPAASRFAKRGVQC